MSDQRRPAAFGMPQPERPPEAMAPRSPRAVDPTRGGLVVPAETDPFDIADVAPLDPPPARPLHRRSRWGALLLGALGLLVSLGVGLWVDGLVRELFERAGWLGWLALGASAAGVLALVVILVREAVALGRLASVARFQRRAEALPRGDMAAARGLVDDLVGFLSAKPQTAAGRRALAELRGEIIDAPDLLRLAEMELLAPLDAEARIAVLNAAKRVSVVTAVSPRALVDVLYVLFEASRLVRRIAELYGGRPGTLGFFRLARRVLAHLAVTGSIAAGDSLVQQLVGHGLAARISARLGEGVVNGMMTARIGIAAMETARPLPFAALRRPGLGDFLAALATFSSDRAGEPPAKE